MLILSPRSLHLHHGAASIPINRPLFADPFNAENDLTFEQIWRFQNVHNL